MCTVLLPPGVNPIAVDKYIISSGNTDGLNTAKRNNAGCLGIISITDRISPSLQLLPVSQTNADPNKVGLF
jgi:hypothetical protein